MIACLSPSDNYKDENISTLTYATKASYIHNEPTRNDDPKVKLIMELKAKIQSLQNELKAANDHIAFLTQMGGGAAGAPGSENYKQFGVPTLPKTVESSKMPTTLNTIQPP